MSIYLAFYGLQKEPFGPTPDPDFLYLTHGHREALAQLLYAIQERKGFVLLTAEVGTGKTTLLHALQRQLDSKTAVAYVANSILPFHAILEYMLEEFEIAKPGESHAQRLVTLQNFLIDRYRAGQNTVLILDEAQNLYPQTLEQIRLLSNFETPTEKILQILLVGQPELRAKLDLPELRQLRQRIAMRASIPLLTAVGARNYIHGRLRIAGASSRGLFTERALTRIAEYVGGIPRVINTVCDHCLLIGYADQTRQIDRAIVEEAIQYLEASGHRGGRRRLPAARRRMRVRPKRMTSVRWAMLGTATALVLGVVSLALFPDGLSQAVGVSTVYLSDLARSIRALLATR